MTERCYLLHVASGAAIFTLLLCRYVAFLHRTVTCRPLFKPSVSLLSTYNTIELCFEFFVAIFKVFILLSLVCCLTILQQNTSLRTCLCFESDTH